MYKDPSEFRKRFKAYKEGKSVREIYGLPEYRSGKLPQYEDGKEDEVDPWQKADVSWHENWLNNRKQQLQNNMSSTGMNGSVDQEIQNQINTLSNVWEYNNPKEYFNSPIIGGITKSTDSGIPYEIIYYEDNPFTKIHERTHGLGLNIPQIKAAQKYVGGSKYTQNPAEIYGKLMESRARLGLQPEYIVGEKDIDQIRKDTNGFFDHLTDSQLIEMYNELAFVFDNNYKNKNILYAKNGKLPKYADGYIRQNNNPVKFDEETGELVDQVTGDKGIMLLPEVTATGQDKTKPYFSSYLFNPATFQTELQNFVKNRAYKSITPVGYNLTKAAKEFITGEREDDYVSDTPMREALFAHYLGIPNFTYINGPGNVSDWIVESPYQPTKGNATYGKTYRFNPEKFSNTPAKGFYESYLSDENIRKYFRERLGQKRNNVLFSDGGSDLGPYTMGSGKDENGYYVSYYDDWDINIGEGYSAPWWAQKMRNILPKGDMLKGILNTNPFTMYDRRYLTEEEWKRLGGYKDGKIAIKPSKRGTFTAAAKKHGASVAEFERRVLKNPEKYSKAMVKKARFSRNARSWKH